MHRFFLPPGQCHPPLLELTGSEAHHARDVLRLTRGAPVTVLDGAGRQFQCEIGDANRQRVLLDVTGENSTPAPCSEVTLIQAVPKGKLIESIIQKAVELGVSRVVPLLSERVTIRLEAEDRRDKAEKWQQVAIEAIKQCGQPWLPEIAIPTALPEFLAGGLPFELALVGSLEGDGRHARHYFDEFQTQLQRAPKTVAAWIGPEGDFSPDELNLIRASGARPITLGPLVLRSETAALYTLSVINHELQGRVGSRG